MAGVSARFTKAGYTRPKYELPLNGRPVFDHAVLSFAACFAGTPFVFVTGPAAGAEAFVAESCRRLGIADFHVVGLDAPTSGQAETVEKGLLALEIAADVPLTIFNIDTFRPGFQCPPPGGAPAPDGWLEVFRGSGDNWSYVEPGPGPEPLVLATAEKRPISDLCCTGLYHFARADDFRQALAAERMAPSMSELYVAPLYNHLIAAGRRVHYRLIARDEVTFCGAPEEYQALGGALA